jgi:hypothetical protein
VTVKVINTGKDSINGFFLAYDMNDLYPAITQYFENKVVPYGDSVTVSFKTKADMTKLGIYNITAYSFNNNDDYILNDTLQINIKNTEIADSLKVFPNPFADKFFIFINSRDNDNLQISITNIAGEKLFTIEKEIIKGKNTINITGLRFAPSIYYLKLRGTTINKTIPILKINM